MCYTAHRVLCGNHIELLAGENVYMYDNAQTPVLDSFKLINTRAHTRKLGCLTKLAFK
jgi:hypothetical protein